MTVLTKKIKKLVLEATIASSTEADKAALSAALTAFADKVYEAHYGEDVVKIRTLRGRWMWTPYRRTFEVDGPMFGPAHDVSERTLDRCLVLSKDQPAPRVKARLEDRELGEACELLKQQAALLKKTAEVTGRTEALLASVNTYKQFAEAWPLGVRFLPPAPVKTRTLSLRGADIELNKLCGLPPAAYK